MRWAIVIGIDEYRGGVPALSAAVSDAERFRDWVLSADGGNVPERQLRLLLGRRDGTPGQSEQEPTVGNIVAAINDVVGSCGNDPEALYFYYAGHGLRARVADRDEDTLATAGFDPVRRPEQSLAVRSLTEHFETTPFKDQFFFLDACRNLVAPERELAIGKWPIPRRRDPGKPPVQQFVMFATSPGLTAAEGAWSGAFSEVLMAAIEGDRTAKAWSWERNCYEVRWEALARYVNGVMSERKEQTAAPAGTRPEDWPIQIPQDTGGRGVAGRERDALLASYANGTFASVTLTLRLEADPREYEAEVSVLDALGEPVASALKVTGDSHPFRLPPKTYAARAVTTDGRRGVVKVPIHLYADDDPTISLEAGSGEQPIGPEELALAGQTRPKGTIQIVSSDPLAVGEICDETGRVVDVGFCTTCIVPPGFYRVRLVGPEAPGEERFVALAAGARETLQLEAPKPEPRIAELAAALGVTPPPWAQPSTVVATAVAAALNAEGGVAEQLGLDASRAGVAVVAVPGEGGAESLARLRVRIWPAGDGIPAKPPALVPSAAGVAAAFRPVDPAVPVQHWVSVEPEGTEPTVVAVPVLRDRLALVVAQVDADRVRMYQFHPRPERHASSAPERLVHVERLQRLLLSGRLDGAAPLARALVERASEDPFGACVAGYVLLRLGQTDELAALAASIAAAAPTLADAAILRGESEAAADRLDAAAQAFADAVNTGVPAFGEGLTRLVEGLRTSAFVHPRGALVRHIFQRHARGSMWAAFVPRRPLTEDGLVIGGADLGFEG